MAFVAVTHVDVTGQDRAEGNSFLQGVLIPMISAQPGFQNARFGRSLDGSKGIGAVMFDTEANAKAALEAMVANRPAEAPPVVGTEIYELVAAA